jgi:uncharacterized protein YtpQ (UPF0354 family)
MSRQTARPRLNMFWRKQTKFTDRGIAYLKASHTEGGGRVVELPPEATPVVRRYSDDLCICFVVDTGKQFEYVQHRHMQEDGIDQDELHRIGLRNLRALVAQRQARVQPYQGVFAFIMRGDFEASVILLDDLWDGEFRQFVTGEYAAAIPARDILAFCDGASADGIAELQRIIDRVQPTGDHLLTKAIYVRRDSGWRPRPV